MPATPPQIGVEFQWMAVSNGDGGTLTLFVTVVDEDEHFTIRAEQTGPSGGTLTIRRANGTVLRAFSVQPGSRALVTLQDTVAINVPFSIARTRCELAGGFRTFLKGARP